MGHFYKLEVTFNEDALQSKLDSVLNDPQVMTDVHKEYAQTIDPWIPYDTGALSKSATPSADGVRYTVDYAAKNYYGDDIRHKTDKHPLATAHWDEVAMQTERDAFAQKVKAIIVRKINGK